jgi:hypothetical protein
LPAESPFASFNRTSVKEVHLVPLGKKNDAASSATRQLSLNLMGHIIAGELASKMEQTPSGLLALSLVQEGTLLLNGQRRSRL